MTSIIHAFHKLTRTSLACPDSLYPIYAWSEAQSPCSARQTCGRLTGQSSTSQLQMVQSPFTQQNKTPTRIHSMAHSIKHA